MVKYDTLIVGAGFAGSVLAERLTNDSQQRVLVVDKHPYVGGSAADHYDEHGILVSRHGAHIFHTKAPRIVEYLSQFTEWRRLEHRVMAHVDSFGLVPFPINRTTVEQVFGRTFESEEQVRDFYELMQEPLPAGGIVNGEQAIVCRIGRELFDLFYRDYTRKHWGMEAHKLSATVTSRVLARATTDDRYFDDPFQAVPRDGYTALFSKMLEGIEVGIGVDWSDVKDEVEYDQLIFTGLIDEFYGYCYGELPYRSVRFESKNYPAQNSNGLSSGHLRQPASVINWPSADVPFTRTIEYRHLTGQNADSTTVHTEFPGDFDEPHYPIPSTEARRLHDRYRRLSNKDRNVMFVGRLGRYQYLTMDQVVGQALKAYDVLKGRRGVILR